MNKSPAQIDAEYQSASGISERRYYKIYYSHIHRFPLLVLGLNPGGETDGTDLAASDSYFEQWEHDYVCFRNTPQYALAKPMCALLATVLETDSVDALRQVPATNVIFRRSRKIEKLNISPAKATEEAKSGLSDILRIVDPKAILFVSKTAYDLFVRYHCDRKRSTEQPSPRIFTNNGSTRDGTIKEACIYLSAVAHVIALERAVSVFVVGHPSKYSSRGEWPEVVSALRSNFQQSGIAPISKSGALVKLKAISGYGTAL